MYSSLDTPYNIPSPPPFIAGSYTEWDFELIDPKSNILIDATKVPNIRFVMAVYGDYSNPVLDFSFKDNTDNIKYITIDPFQKNHITIYLYATYTEYFEDTYYDFQIEFIDFDKKTSSVIGQGRVKVFGRIENIENPTPSIK